MVRSAEDEFVQPRGARNGVASAIRCLDRTNENERGRAAEATILRDWAPRACSNALRRPVDVRAGERPRKSAVLVSASTAALSGLCPSTF
jgi:hypothetical protein